MTTPHGIARVKRKVAECADRDALVAYWNVLSYPTQKDPEVVAIFKAKAGSFK